MATQTLSITKDTYTSNYSASTLNTNYGSSTNLAYGQTQGKFYYLWLEVPLPTGETIESVKVSLTHPVTNKPAGTVDIGIPSAPWSQSTLTWNNQPSITWVATRALPAKATNERYEIDLTGIDLTNGVVITRNDNDFYYASSYETTTAAYRPEVVVTTSDGTPRTVVAGPMFGSGSMPDAAGYGNIQRLNITDDALVSIDAPTTNYGTSATMLLGTNRFGLFKVPAISGSDATTSAKLYVKSTATNVGSLPFSIYAITSAWDEGSVTWNTRPTTELVRSVSYDAKTTGLYEFDITGVDQGFGVAISGPGISMMTAENADTTGRPYVLAATAPVANASLSADAITATGNMPDPLVVATDSVSAAASPMTASAAMGDAQASTEQVIDVALTAEPMTAEATWPTTAGFSDPYTAVAEAMAGTGEAVDASVSTTRGVKFKTTPATASARMVDGLVNGQKPALSEDNDTYLAAILAAAPKTYFRLSESGTEQPRLGTGTLIHHGTQTGLNDAPNGRHSVYMDGAAYLEQTEGGIGVEESLVTSGNPARTTVEFSFRTTKRDQFIMAGRDDLTRSQGSEAVPAFELYLKDGKISFRSHYWNRSPWDFTGFKDLADGQWHHIAIRSQEVDSSSTGTDRNEGVEIWVDGKFEIRRVRAPYEQFGNLGVTPIVGFPDYIGSRPSGFDGYNFGALPTGMGFVGDMTEFSFFSRKLTGEEIPRHYYAFKGWTPIEVEPIESFAFMTDGNKGRGNQKRALYLWWSEESTAYWRDGGASGPVGMNFDPLPAAKGKYSGTYNLNGFKVFAKSIVNKASGVPYRDARTDMPSLINLETDINIDDYDAIFFGDWPDSGAEVEFYEFTFPGERERLIEQLRWANNKGINLMVTQPRLAVDLGIIDRVEFVPTLREQMDPLAAALSPGQTLAQGGAAGLYDYGSAVKFPWNIVATSGVEGNASVGSSFNGQPQNLDPVFLANKAFFYADHNFNNRFRVRALIEGLTDIPSYMISDAIWHRDYDLWGNYIRAFKYLHREDGLRIGDEFLIHGTDPGWVDGDHRTTSGSTWERYGRPKGYYATPLANVKAGTVVTTFGAKHWFEKSQVDNPYMDYATTIVLQPGDKLAGKPVGGRIFVNFTEQPNQHRLDVPVQKVPANDELPYTYKAETPEQREWEWSETRFAFNTSTLGGGAGTTVTITLPDGTTSQVPITNTGSGLSMVNINPLFPTENKPRWDMVRRGFAWLQERVEIDPGAVTVGAEPMTAEASMPNAPVSSERDVSVNAEQMLGTATLVRPAEGVVSDVEVRALPMTATGRFTGSNKTIKVQPMTGNAEVVENFEMVSATGEQVILTLHGLDLVTLYLKEEA